MQCPWAWLVAKVDGSVLKWRKKIKEVDLLRLFELEVKGFGPFGSLLQRECPLDDYFR